MIGGPFVEVFGFQGYLVYSPFNVTLLMFLAAILHAEISLYLLGPPTITPTFHNYFYEGQSG